MTPVKWHIEPGVRLGDKRVVDGVLFTATRPEHHGRPYMPPYIWDCGPMASPIWPAQLWQSQPFKVDGMTSATFEAAARRSIMNQKARYEAAKLLVLAYEAAKASVTSERVEE